MDRHTRKDLAKVVPGLRPWEIISLEQTMDLITYNGNWYREPLSQFTTPPEYIIPYNEEMKMLFEYANAAVPEFYKTVKEKGIPIDDLMLEAVKEDRC